VFGEINTNKAQFCAAHKPPHFRNVKVIPYKMSVNSQQFETQYLMTTTPTECGPEEPGRCWVGRERERQRERERGEGNGRASGAKRNTNVFANGQ
jgi:hypothetical protein